MEIRNGRETNYGKRFKTLHRKLAWEQAHGHFIRGKSASNTFISIWYSHWCWQCSHFKSTIARHWRVWRGCQVHSVSIDFTIAMFISWDNIRIHGLYACTMQATCVLFSCSIYVQTILSCKFNLNFNTCRHDFLHNEKIAIFFPARNECYWNSTNIINHKRCEMEILHELKRLFEQIYIE